MEYVSRASAVRHANSSQCAVYEYPTQNKDINIGVAEISGRYPEAGYAMNEKCTEMGYILKGSGKLVTEDQEIDLSPGDVVSILPGEKYYWEGNFTVVLPSTPAWHPGQHRVGFNYENE